MDTDQTTKTPQDNMSKESISTIARGARGGDTPATKFDVFEGKHFENQPGRLELLEFESIEDERRYRLERLAASFRLFSKCGFDEGVAGHITCRDPELQDHFWVNPFAMHFSQISVSDLLLVDHEGNIVHGDRPVNQAAFAIHSRLHMARPDVMAAAHSHSVYGRTFSTLGKQLDPITQDACAFYDNTVVFDDYTGVVAETSEGDRIAAKLGEDKRHVILQNHGLLTTGETVEAATWAFICMERCCQSQLMAEATGGNGPSLIRDDVAKETCNLVGSQTAGWVSFQPLYDRIVKEQPDLLD